MGQFALGWGMAGNALPIIALAAGADGLVASIPAT